MPVYEYACKHCGHVGERYLKVSEAEAKMSCEKCGKPAEKILTGFGSYEIRGDNSGSTPPKSKVKK